MSWPLIISIVALGFHLGSVILWLTPVLRRYLEKWIWYSVFIGLASVAVHRIVEVAQTPDDHLFGPISALVIALVAFFSVKHAHQAIRRRVYLENHVKTLNQSLAKLQQELEQRGHVAEHLAVILNDLRTKIDYYEQQAEAHKLPRYTETAQTN